MKALFAGSFSPPTCGHLDIIRRGAQLFDELLVAVLSQAGKAYPLAPERRAQMLRTITRDMPNVKIVHSEGLLVDLMRETGAEVILRGVREPIDMREELQIAEAHRKLGGYETLFLPSLPEHSRLSSTIVRDCAFHQADLRGMAPDEIIDEIYAVYAKARI
ncbi:MAG: pantetheine-phosphate adenylyltransferase [Christensenellales bacterium]|jgi:pantetheine-phosphate adenylyltransferase